MQREREELHRLFLNWLFGPADLHLADYRATLPLVTHNTERTQEDARQTTSDQQAGLCPDRTSDAA